MCVLCGTPDPSHDMLLLRAAVLAGGTGFILTPRKWLSQMKVTLLRKLSQQRRDYGDPLAACSRSSSARTTRRSV